jgi:hypothetical protein
MVSEKLPFWPARRSVTEKLLHLGLFLLAFGALVAVAILDKRLLELERSQDRLPGAAEEACRRGIEATKAQIERMEQVARYLETDIDVAHTKVDDLKIALEAVARTVPWRARAPRIPRRHRPRGSVGLWASQDGN